MPVPRDHLSGLEHRAQRRRAGFAERITKRQLVQSAELGDERADVSETAYGPLVRPAQLRSQLEHGWCFFTRERVGRAAALGHHQVQPSLDEQKVVRGVLAVAGCVAGRDAQAAPRGGRGLHRGPARALLDEVPELREQVVRDEVAEVAHGIELQGHGHQRARRRVQERDEHRLLLLRGEMVRVRRRDRVASAAAAAAAAAGAESDAATARMPAPARAAAAVPGRVEPTHRARPSEWTRGAAAE